MRRRRRNAVTIVSIRQIERQILGLRGKRVMLGPDLANLYGVEVKALVQAVKRNGGRFPSDFMFQLSPAEWRVLKSQFVTSKRGGIRRARPYAFTQEGIAMLSSVLSSIRAMQVNVEIMRAFVRARERLVSRTELARRLADLEQRYDGQFAEVFEQIRMVMARSEESRRGQIGFGAPN